MAAMIRCVDTFSEIPTIYPNGVFDLARWRAYAQNHFGENISLFEDDMNECLATGSYTFERDYLPVLQAVWQHPLAGGNAPVLPGGSEGAFGTANAEVWQRFGCGKGLAIVP